MPCYYCFLKAGMLSLRSGWLPFYQEKGKSPHGDERKKARANDITAKALRSPLSWE